LAKKLEFYLFVNPEERLEQTKPTIFPVVDVFIKDFTKFVAWRISTSEQIGMIQALFAIFHSLSSVTVYSVDVMFSSYLMKEF
jgi:hypothetical protein